MIQRKIILFYFTQKSHPQGNGVSFSCQHGADECAGNKIHSCGLREAQTQAAQVEFVTCQMSYGSEGSDLVIIILISTNILIKPGDTFFLHIKLTFH